MGVLDLRRARYVDLLQARPWEAQHAIGCVSRHFLLQARPQYAAFVVQLLLSRGVDAGTAELARAAIRDGSPEDALAAVRDVIARHGCAGDFLRLYAQSGVRLLRMPLRTLTLQAQMAAVALPDGVVHCCVVTGSEEPVALMTAYPEDACPYGIAHELVSKRRLLKLLRAVCHELQLQDLYVAVIPDADMLAEYLIYGRSRMHAEGFAPVIADSVRMVPFPRRIVACDPATDAALARLQQQRWAVDDARVMRELRAAAPGAHGLAHGSPTLSVLVQRVHQAGEDQMGNLLHAVHAARADAPELQALQRILQQAQGMRLFWTRLG